MNYWWVSQNQTYRAEATGGYLWSPKTNADGSRSQHYDFMREIRPYDLVFSYVGGKIKSVGIALSEAYTSQKPQEFGKRGQVWNAEGWRVDIDYHEVLVEVSPKDDWDHISKLLPSKYSPLNKDGNGAQAYLFKIGEPLAMRLITLTSTLVPDKPVLELSKIDFRAEEQEIIVDQALRETQKVQLVQARRGQGTFRNRVKIVERECRITHVSEEKLLVASHIKPWDSSDNEERLNGNNGLFLSPHVDKLFDKGFISFERDGDLMVADSLNRDVLKKWSIDPKQRYGKFNADQNYFLEHHRQEVFQS